MGCGLLFGVAFFRATRESIGSPGVSDSRLFAAASIPARKEGLFPFKGEFLGLLSSLGGSSFCLFTVLSSLTISSSSSSELALSLHFVPRAAWISARKDFPCLGFCEDLLPLVVFVFEGGGGGGTGCSFEIPAGDPSLESVSCLLSICVLSPSPLGLCLVARILLWTSSFLCFAAVLSSNWCLGITWSSSSVIVSCTTTTSSDISLVRSYSNPQDIRKRSVINSFVS